MNIEELKNNLLYLTQLSEERIHASIVYRIQVFLNNNIMKSSILKNILEDCQKHPLADDDCLEIIHESWRALANLEFNSQNF